MNKQIIMFGDIVEENDRTIRENRQAIKHAIPLGAMVEVVYDEYLGDGCGRAVWERMYVIAHNRDCDGSPLYGLGRVPPDQWLEHYHTTVEEWQQLGTFDAKKLLINAMVQSSHGYGEDSLTVVEITDRVLKGYGIPTTKQMTIKKDPDA